MYLYGQAYEELKKVECPVVFSHGTIDRKVDYRDSVEYVQYPIGEAILFLYKGFDHGFHKLHEQDRLVKDLLHFFELLDLEKASNQVSEKNCYL